MNHLNCSYESDADLSEYHKQNNRQRLEEKVAYLQHELEQLKDYYYVPETYQMLVAELDAQQVLLKRLEVQDHFAKIDSHGSALATSFVRS